MPQVCPKMVCESGPRGIRPSDLLWLPYSPLAACCAWQQTAYNENYKTKLESVSLSFKSHYKSTVL